MLSKTRELEGQPLMLNVGKREWTTTLLIPVGLHQFQFLVNGKEKTLSPLHEKENTWFFGGWKNIIQLIPSPEAALRLYETLPFPRQEFPIINNCFYLFSFVHSSCPQAFNSVTRPHSK
jgi:hypothetical protein